MFMINAGREYGYSIQAVTPGNYCDELLNSADLLILNNLSLFTREQINHMLDFKYVWYLHDCQGDGIRFWSNAHTANEHPGILEKARCLIFLSPFHYHWYKKHFKLGNALFYCIPPYIPPEFHDSGGDRPCMCIHLSPVTSAQGMESVMEYAILNPSMHIDFYYSSVHQKVIDELISISNCHIKGAVEYDKIPDLLRNYKYFIHLPSDNCMEAFSRSTAEAALCGCELLVNGNIGALSYLWFTTYRILRKETLASPARFWRLIEYVSKR